MEERKFWLFYLKETDKLYAYTSSKEYAHDFMKTRNMSKFILSKETLTPDETNDLYRIHLNKILDKFYGHTDYNGELVEFDMIMTKFEITTIIQDMAYYATDAITKTTVAPPHCINHKYQDALKTLMYPIVYAYHKGDYTNATKMMGRMHTDDMKIILENYGDTFRGGI